MSAQQALAVVRILIVLAALWVIIRNRCQPDNLVYSVPYIAWLVHAVVYLVVYLIDSHDGFVSPAAYNIWGAGLQIQGYLTVLMVESARYYRQRKHHTRGESGC
jgi:hypothetical protein